ncbi:Heparan sulfate glucosamine 3-O-sulfotransferase 5 [Mactra antiquata]
MDTFKKYCFFIFPFCIFVIIAFGLAAIKDSNYVYLDFTPIQNETKTSLKVNESFGENQTDWKIIYDEVKLRTEIENIHNRSYIIKDGDKCRKDVPDLMIVGVAKCGTRELIDFMSIHPWIIAKNNPYQINSKYFGGKNSYKIITDKMPCKYHDQINVLKADAFLTQYSKPEELYNMNPNMKIIAIIREPIARLKSHLSFRPSANVSKTVIETTDRFIKFIKGKRTSKSYNKMLLLSTYDVGLERYLKVFRRDQVLVIESTEFMKNPITVLKKVEHLLGIEPFNWDKYFILNKQKGFYCIRKVKKVMKTMVCYNSNRGRKDPSEIIDAEHMERLCDYFKPHNENLFRLIGRRFDW